MQTLSIKNTLVLAGVAALPFLQGCQDTPDTVAPEEVRDYAIFITAGNSSSGESYYTLTTNDLNKDTLISPVKSGIVADADLFWAQYYSAFKDGNFYFTLDGNVLSKQRIENGKYVEKGNVVAEAGSWQLGMMKTFFTTNVMNFLSWETKYDEATNTIEKNMYVVGTENMSVQSKNPIRFPLPSFPMYDYEGNPMAKEDIPLTPSSFTIRDNKIFIGYFYDWGTEIDTTYMLVCDYPSLQNVKVMKDARLGHVSGIWVGSSSSFTDEKGEYYFTTFNEKNKNYGILRIKSGSTEIDPTYAFSLAGHPISFSTYDYHSYLKNGLAFVGSYIVDVYNQKVVKDLNSFGLGTVQETMETYKENDNDLYVILKTSDARWFIAKYDVAKNTLDRGVEIDGGIQGVKRVSRLK